MRSALIVLLLVGLSIAAAGASIAHATHSGPELRKYGRGDIGLHQFDFSARLGPHEATDPFGEPHGHMTWRIPGSNASLTAEVTCLSVVGNPAKIGGRVTRASGFLAQFTVVFFDVVDNTTPMGNVVADEWAASAFPVGTPVPQVCPTPTAGLNLTDGDIVVEQN